MSEIGSEMYIGLYAITRNFCSILMKLELSEQIFK